MSAFKPLRMIGTVEELTPRWTERVASQLHTTLAAVLLLATSTDWAAGLVGVERERIGCRWLRLLNLSWRWRRLKCLAEGYEGGAIAAAVTAVTTRFGESFGENMNAEVANELNPRLLYIDLTLGAILASRSGFECNDVVDATDKPLVGDGTAGHVAS